MGQGSVAKPSDPGYCNSDQRWAVQQAPETLSNFLRIHFQHSSSAKSQQKHAATKLHLKRASCQQPCCASKEGLGAGLRWDAMGSTEGELAPDILSLWLKTGAAGTATRSRLKTQNGLGHLLPPSHRVWHCWHWALQPLNAAFVFMSSRLLQEAGGLHPYTSLSPRNHTTKKLKLYKTFPWRVRFGFWAPLRCL